MFHNKLSLVTSAVLIATLGLTGCGGGSSGSTSQPDPEPPASTNQAPTAIALSQNEVAENAVAAAIGTLTATDADSNETFSYSVDDSRFEVVGDALQLTAGTALDFETEQTVAITITVTDSGGNTFDESLTINVTDVLEAPATFAFESRFSSESSVNYSGQTARHVLISELNNYIDNQLEADVNDNIVTSKAEALAKMHSFYAISDEDYDLLIGDRVLTLSATPGIVQTSLKQISSSHKDLSGKIAGNDATGQHKDWTTALVGWNAAGSTSPEGLALSIMEQIADNVQTHVNGTLRFDPMGDPISDFYLSENGVDLKQMLQKFLLGALAFSQGADDYLDDDIDGKGLNSDNTQGDKDGTKPYTALEHSFDEGFGYFGAARDYNSYADAEVSAKGGREDWQLYHDSNADGSIDLGAEINFGNATNAAKRDLGSADNANPTDFSQAAFDAFLMGRAIITDADGALTDAQMNALQAQRDVIVGNWEKSISSTVVHYINDTIADIEKLGTDDYSFSTAAKHWSEMKGFALSFQFNPRTPLTAQLFAELHQLLGMASVTDEADVAAYKENLLAARAILQTAYDFDPQNVAQW